MALTEDERRRRNREYQRKWAASNPERKKLFTKRWQEKNVEHRTKYAKGYSAGYRAKNYLKIRSKKHGISSDQFLALYNRHDGACWICKEKFKSFSKAHVDHDHKTGKVRGMLCNGCNSGLGHFRDNPEYLKNGAQYLEDQD